MSLHIIQLLHHGQPVGTGTLPVVERLLLASLHQEQEHPHQAVPALLAPKPVPQCLLPAQALGNEPSALERRDDHIEEYTKVTSRLEKSFIVSKIVDIIRKNAARLGGSGFVRKVRMRYSRL